MPLTIQGVVREFAPAQNNPPIPGATVQIFDRNRQKVTEGVTDGAGKYQVLANLPASNGEITCLVLALKDGHRNSSRRRRTRQPAITVNLDLLKSP